MKPSREVRSLIRAGVVAAGLAAVWNGCEQRDATTTAAARIEACDISSDSVRRLTRREFIAWGRRLSYDPENRSAGQAYGFAAGADVRVFRARGMDSVTRAQLADGCLIARVFSQTADTVIGLGDGWTYIWADSSSPYSASFVPEDSTAPVVGQNMALDTSGVAPEPTLVQSPRHICSDCGRDWCVYPRDTLRTDPVLFEPEPAPAPEPN